MHKFVQEVASTQVTRYKKKKQNLYPWPGTVSKMVLYATGLDSGVVAIKHVARSKVLDWDTVSRILSIPPPSPFILPWCHLGKLLHLRASIYWHMRPSGYSPSPVPQHSPKILPDINALEIETLLEKK